MVLKHHGIKGQKWGIQNGPPYPLDDHGQNNDSTEIRTNTKSGAEVVMGQRPTKKFTRFIAKYFPSIRKNIENDKQFNITVNGKRIGDAEIFKESDDSVNVVWVGIDKSYRGNGYATAVMNGIVGFAKSEGFKRITLEVPGSSPDARHIYEKLGFKVDHILSEDDVWDGLTAMVLDL